MKDLNFYYALLIFIANMHGLLTLKMKKGITITKDFQEILSKSGRKPNNR